jgi:hypothetical protein
VTTKKNALNIIGDGAALTTIRGPCSARNEIVGHCDEFDGAPVLQVAKDAALVIDSITITNGDPGISNEGSLEVYRSTIAFNGNHFGAGGIVNSGPGSWIYLQDSTVSNNGSHHGPGGGITNQEGFVQIAYSTIHNNWVYYACDEGSFGGGGIANGSATYKVDKNGNYVMENGKYVVEARTGGWLSIANSTIYGNVDKALCGPYSHAGGIVNNGDGVVWLGSVTITNNNNGSDSASVGGVFSSNDFSSDDSQNGRGLHFFNTIIARNGDIGRDCGGLLYSLGGNLLGKCDAYDANHNVGVKRVLTWDPDPRLVPRAEDVWPEKPELALDEGFGKPLLKDNGGNSCTVALKDTSSPALNRGWKGAPGSHPLACAEYDQRWLRRNRSGEWTCDIGAYEYQKGKSTPSGLSCD